MAGDMFWTTRYRDCTCFIRGKVQSSFIFVLRMYFTLASKIFQNDKDFVTFWLLKCLASVDLLYRLVTTYRQSGEIKN